MLEPSTDRRKFLVCLIAFSGLAACSGATTTARLSNALAHTSDQLDQDTRDAMLRMARLLYPHDGLSDDVYVEVLSQVLGSTAEDEALAATLQAAEDALNARQTENFIDLDEEAQIAGLRSIENTDFFQAVQLAVRSRLYDHPAVWELIHYEGPSFQQGGYLNRGAGEIDWLVDDG